MQNARINVRRLAKRLLLSLVLPVLIAGIIDMTVGTYPWLIIAASVVCIPLATFVVIRTALAELDSLIRRITPEPLPEQAPESIAGPAAGQPGD
jgi:F0F1-type ATP synthase assembly protein I